MRRAICLLGIALFVPFASLADPLPVTDQNPLLSGFMTSRSLPARLNPKRLWTFETSLAWGNSAIVQAGPRESLVVDAETQELRLVAQRSLGDESALRIQIPYRHTSAGSLDGFIDQWHHTFGLPEGARPSLPDDALRVFYRRDGMVHLDSSSSTQGIGDVSFDVGRALASSPESAVMAWLGLKLPTGDAEDFTGSGSVDVSAAIAGEHRFGDRWEVFGQIAATWIGEGDRRVSAQHDWVGSGLAGLSVRAIGSLVLTAQVDAHTAVFDSENLDFLGDAVVLSVGGSYRFASGWELALGVSEDIAVESAPDVVFLFGLKQTF